MSGACSPLEWPRCRGGRCRAPACPSRRATAWARGRRERSSAWRACPTGASWSRTGGRRSARPASIPPTPTASGAPPARSGSAGEGRGRPGSARRRATEPGRGGAAAGEEGAGGDGRRCAPSTEGEERREGAALGVGGGGIGVGGEAGPSAEAGGPRREAGINGARDRYETGFHRAPPQLSRARS